LDVDPTTKQSKLVWNALGLLRATMALSEQPVLCTGRDEALSPISVASKQLRPTNSHGALQGGY